MTRIPFEGDPELIQAPTRKDPMNEAAVRTPEAPDVTIVVTSYAVLVGDARVDVALHADAFPDDEDSPEGWTVEAEGRVNPVLFGSYARARRFAIETARLLDEDHRRSSETSQRILALLNSLPRKD